MTLKSFSDMHKLYDRKENFHKTPKSLWISHTYTRKFELFVNFLCFDHGQVGTVLLQWELFFPPVPTRRFLFLP